MVNSYCFNSIWLILHIKADWSQYLRSYAMYTVLYGEVCTRHTVQIYKENLTCFGKSTFNFLHDDSHIIILFSFGKKGLVLTFIKIKANLFLPLAYQKGIQNLQSQLYIIWLKSILVLLNHFSINDDLYKYKYICKGHALINILHLRVAWSTYCTSRINMHL